MLINNPFLFPKTEIPITKILIIVLAHILLIPGIVRSQERGTTEQFNALMESCRFSEAITLVDQYLQQDSTRTNLLLIKGRALAAGFQYREAIATLLKVQKLDSSSVLVLKELVNVYQQSGDPEKAISTNLILCRLVPGNRFFSLQLSNLYFSENKYRQALQVLLPLYKTDSSDFYVSRQISNCYDELRRPDTAEFYFKRALELAPYDPIVTGKLANMYIRADKADIALELTQQYLAQDSANISILKQNAYCNYLVWEFGTAAMQFRKCVKMGDVSKFTNKYLGMSYYKQEKYDTAAPFFRAAFLKDTTDAELCFYYGVSESRSLGIDTGLVYLERTLRMLMPPSAFLSTLYTELAGAYNGHGGSDKAVEMLQKALEVNPENNNLRFKIAYEYDFYLRKPNEALPYYREYLKNAVLLNQSGATLPQPDSGYEKTEDGNIIFTYGDYAKNRIREISTGRKK